MCGETKGDLILFNAKDADATESLHERCDLAAPFHSLSKALRLNLPIFLLLGAQTHLLHLQF